MMTDMMTDRLTLDLYPPIETPAKGDLRWEAVIRLSHHDPVVRHTAMMAEQGDLTREQALIAAVFALYNQKAQMFATELNRRNAAPSDFIVHEGKTYVRQA
jgi:hypothetical protein